MTSQLARLFATAGLLLTVLAGAACGAKAQARTAPERQPLEVPPAPPRSVEPLDEVAAATASDNATLEGDPAATRPATRSARPPAAKTDTPAPKAAEPARTDPEPRAAPPAAGARLRTPQTADERETERAVRDLLTRAGRQLGRVNYTRLSRDGKAQYDTAKRFMAQCEDALKEKNFVFARYLADKADTLASQLVGR